MQLQTMRIANSVIGVSLLAMLAAALIAGQARANLHPPVLLADADQRPEYGLVLTHGSLKRLDALPQVIDALGALPLTIKISIDGVTIRPARMHPTKYRAD